MTRSPLSISLKNVIAFLVLALLCTTPLYQMGEIFSVLISGTLEVKIATPAYIKVLKDFGMILIFCTSLVYLFKVKKVSLFLVILAFIVITLLPSMSYMLSNDLIIFISGVRWFFPVVLAFLLVEIVTKELLEKIATVLVILFLFHFMMQIYELLTLKYYGVNSLGFNIRNPGMFYMPGTAGAYSLMTFLFTIYYFKHNRFRRVLILLTVISILLTASATSVMILAIVILVLFLGKKYFNLIWFLLPFIVVVLLLSVEVVIARNNVIEGSLFTRFQLFMDLIDNVSYFSNNFGGASSSAFLIGNYIPVDEKYLIATDSLFSSILANTGIIGFFTFLLLLWVWFYIAIKLKNIELIAFNVTFFLLSLTMPLTELFPVNLLFSIFIGYQLKILKPLFIKNKIYKANDV